MRHCACHAAIFALFFCLSPCVAQTSGPSIAVLRSGEAKGSIRPNHIRRIYDLAVTEVAPSMAKPPRIVVVNGCVHSAEVIGLQYDAPRGKEGSGGILVERNPSGEPVYFLWIVGVPADDVLVRGIVNILVVHTDAPQARVPEAVRKVKARLRNTVDIADFQAH